MKKQSRILLAILAGIYAFSSTAAYAAEGAVDVKDFAAPLFSTQQVTELKDQFVFWLGKHYRCLYGGKCTKIEKAEVVAQWKRWIKNIGIGTALALLAYFGPKAVSKVERRISARRQAAVEAARRDVLNLIDPFIQAVDLAPGVYQQIDRRYGIAMTPKRAEAIQREKLKVLFQTGRLQAMVQQVVAGATEGILSRELTPTELQELQPELKGLTTRKQRKMIAEKQRELRQAEIADLTNAVMGRLLGKLPEIEVSGPMGLGVKVRPWAGAGAASTEAERVPEAGEPGQPRYAGAGAVPFRGMGYGPAVSAFGGGAP